MLIVGAEIEGRADQRVRVIDGIITDVGTRRDCKGRSDELVLDAAGGAVIPGIHDHHVHLRATAAEEASVRLGPPDVTDRMGFEGRLREAAAKAVPAAWVRGVGYHERVAGPLDRNRLDEVVPSCPVRIQHRTGSLWILNSRALAEIDAERHHLPGLERDDHGCLTGRLWRLDAWLGSIVPRVPVDLAGLSRQAAAMGITGFTDATPDRGADDLDNFERLLGSRKMLQRLTLMASHDLAWPVGARVQRGPVKLVLDDSDLPDVDDLASAIRSAHEHGCPVAVHCVTAEQLVVLIGALQRAGSRAGDRIEHAAVVPPALVGDLRALGVTVVVQPAFVFERGDDYLREVDAEEQQWLYPCASLLASGVPVAASSDAPYSGLDPWAAMRAAAQRMTRCGCVLNGPEKVGADVALRMFLGSASWPARPRRVAPGQAADLCVLRAPLADVLSDPAKEAVAATVIGGEVVFCDARV